MADFVLVVVCLIKLIPIMHILIWLYIWIAIIAFIKIINVVLGCIVQKKFVSVHSVMNKVTGAMLFVFPLALSIIDFKYIVIFICMVATLAAIQEGYLNNAC